MLKSFSERYGPRPEQDVLVREDAPQELREAVSQLAKRAGMNYLELRDVICKTLLVEPNPNNWGEVPYVRNEVFWHLGRCHWFKVYDIVEAIYAGLPDSCTDDSRETFSNSLNQFFREQGIGWDMDEGSIQYRGAEPFTHALKGAATALSSTGRSQAAKELAEAVRDISRRPEPDVTGAVQHAMAALEATARDITGQEKATLGKLIGSLGLKPPLDIALDKLWGYASNEARHGREDSTLSTDEAELIVGVAGVVCGFLANTRPGRSRKMA